MDLEHNARVSDMPNEDADMHNKVTDGPRVHRPAITETELLTSKSKDKMMLEDVTICDKKDHTQKRSSPAFRSVSELQENVNVKPLFKPIMNKDMTIGLGDILGSSFELGKSLHIGSKTQRLLVTPEATHAKSDDILINSAEYGTNHLEMKK
ncbi:hypothetical protein BS47DRAFT_1387651 [Hydnum rufescens UP504]|uniref:DUF4100 domain-containing protein n=1 Tax=Hydnum rufescens UP504 TaxID=1448309 RepID=A0A9P6BC49_9AGAM|nr:hypothetical protein BS47DRAFT_1387651 [Hydnum rufescens UP504]